MTNIDIWNERIKQLNIIFSDTRRVSVQYVYGVRLKQFNIKLLCPDGKCEPTPICERSLNGPHTHTEWQRNYKYDNYYNYI